MTSEDEFQVLVVTSDSNIFLNQLVVAENGVYRCLLQDGNGTVYSSTHFTLTGEVLPKMLLFTLHDKFSSGNLQYASSILWPLREDFLR